MSLESKKRKEEEYEMQLFGFHSRAVQATMEHIVGEKIESCCKKLSESLKKMYKDRDNIAADIQHAEKNLIKLYYLHSQPHISIMKRCIKKFIHVPGNILLNEDSAQANKYSQEEFQHIEAHLKGLQLRTKKAIILHAALEEELCTLKEFEPDENELNILSSVIENGSLHSGIDGDIINCIRNSHVLEDIVKDSRSSTFVNRYKNSIYNLGVKELDLDAPSSCNPSV